MKKLQSYFDSRGFNLVLLLFIPLLLITLGFIVDGPKTVFKGLYDIILAPDILLTDYLAVGGIGASFLNIGLLGLLCIFLIYILKAPLTGPLIAALLTVIGFGFIGKNIANVLPILFGALLYCHHKNVRYKTILTPIFFATTLAPAVSEIAFGLNLNHFISIPLGILTGVLIGFIIIPVSQQIIHFHGGYNLYNIGFTGGIIGTLITAFVEGLGFTINTQSNLSTEYSTFIKIILIIISVFYLVIGYIMNNRSFKGYLNVVNNSGHALADFTDRFSYALGYINIGVMGLISILFVILLKGTFNGPVAAGVITVIAFSTFGKNPKNSIPIFIGVFLASFARAMDFSSTTVIISALFGTALAPVAGTYGFIPGVIAGFVHLFMVANVIKIHSGLNLYNNGFSCGVVAGILVPIFQSFADEKKVQSNRK